NSTNNHLVEKKKTIGANVEEIKGFADGIEQMDITQDNNKTVKVYDYELWPVWLKPFEISSSKLKLMFCKTATNPQRKWI
ncbi:hypothetical protein K1T71_006891, partial [Dendrolimus kikuchii]